MHHTASETILGYLHDVERERHHRMGIPGLPMRTEQLKQFQQARFRLSYTDLLEHPRYAGAAQFFLNHLYGPGDFSRRDAQFARVIPAVVRLFPADVIGTVARLAELHALSESLDTHMAEQLLQTSGPTISPGDYIAAWQRTGKPEHRRRQIELTLAIGEELDRLTRRPLLRQALRMMRGPASAAGLHDLQNFLEVGFDTFRAMKGPEHFLHTVEQRELELAERLFAVVPKAKTATEQTAWDQAIRSLPARI